MKNEIQWSREALESLAATEHYIAMDSPERAADFSSYLINKAEQIPAHPKQGRVVQEIGNGSIRELLLKNYRLIYEIKSVGVEVLTVFEGHKKMDTKVWGDN